MTLLRCAFATVCAALFQLGQDATWGLEADRLFDAAASGCYDQPAGWSSLVARWAHNPKVGGSNPPPATKHLSFQRLEY